MIKNDKIDELLKQSESYDMDHRFMAANDLCAALLQPNNNLDSKYVEKIIQVFIKQLDDSTADNKGNAIKCLAKVVTKIPENLVSEVCKKLISNITNPPKKEEIRNIDIYTTCLKTLINEIPEDFAEIMCKTLTNAGLTKRTEVAEINEELIDITNHLVKRFSVFLSKQSSLLNKDVLIKDLLKNIKEEKSSLRKKASLCLGSFSIILSTKDVSSVSDTLVDSIVKSKGKKELLYYTIGFNAVVKNAAHKLPGTIKTIFPFILKHIGEIIEDPGDNFEFTNELVDYYLSIIDYSIRLLPIETKSYISDVLTLVTRLISYDPNYGGDDDAGLDIEDQEEDGYDDYDGYDDDDSSWKVRRAAVQVANTLILTHPELLRKLAEGVFEKLVRRFKEKEQNVKLEVFNALSNFLRMMIYGEGKEGDDMDQMLELPTLTRSRSILADNSNKIVSMISSLIKVFKDKKSNANLKISASNLLCRAAKFTSDAVIEKIDDVLPLITSEYSQSGNSNELKVNMLKSLRFLLKSQASKRESKLEKKYNDIVKLISSAIKNDYFRISSEGFKVLSLFYKALRPDASSNSNGFKDYIKGIFGNIIDKLKENDIDQEIKYAVTINATVLVSTFGDVMSSDELVQVFTHLLTKLKSEIKRQQTMKALSMIPTSSLKLQGSKEFYALLGNFLEELFSLTLKQDRTIKIAALEVMMMVLGIFREDLSEKLQKEIIQKVSPFIKDEDFYMAQISIGLLIHIIKISPKKHEEYSETVKNCINLARSNLIQGVTVERLEELFRCFGSYEIADPKSIVKELTTEINKSSLGTTAKCLAAVTDKVQSVINPYIAVFTGNLGSKDALLQQLSLFTLSELGRKIDFSSDKKVLEGILGLFDSKDEDVKYSAAVALGGISLGNVNHYLPIVIETIANKKDYQYLLLNTLKEIITGGDKTAHSILEAKGILEFLFKFSETQNENLRQSVAECIGKLALQNLSKASKLILDGVKSKDLNTKNTVAFAYRYFCTKRTNYDTLQDLKLIDPLFSLVGEKDLNIKKSALGSLNALIYNIPKAISGVNKDFLAALADVSKFNSALVKEIELGPFKHKVDEGLPIRTSAFSFVDTALESLLERNEHVSFLLDEILLGMSDPADDVQILSYQILTKFAHLSPHALVSYTDKIVEKFDESHAKFVKSLGSNQEGERVNDTIRAYIRAFHSLNKIPEIEGLPKFKDFYQEKIMKQAKLKDILAQLQGSV